jgi:hypothetical protein
VEIECGVLDGQPRVAKRSQVTLGEDHNVQYEHLSNYFVCFKINSPDELFHFDILDLKTKLVSEVTVRFLHSNHFVTYWLSR